MNILDKNEINRDVRKALQEDIGAGDVSAVLLPPDLEVEAVIISREAMVVCGQPWVETVFREVNPEIKLKWLVKEGSWLAGPATLCVLTGLAHAILTAERVALNFLQTLSGTATQTRAYLLRLDGGKVCLLDTRKTIPGLRLAQKYAVSCAGGVNHRLGLFDAFLIKENHIKACGSITNAIAKARALRPDLMIEVEVENKVEFQEALASKPDRILLDNFTEDQLVDVVKQNQGRCPLEASGGINLANINRIAKTGVDYISVGDITKSIRAIDLSLLIRSTQHGN